MINGLLVVVSCGRTKVWDKHPQMGAVAAKTAYSSPVFKASRRYAEHFAEKWVILSAKYGFIEPDTLIEKYDVSFYDDGSVKLPVLEQQVRMLALDQFNTVGVLGSEIYWRNARRAFDLQRVDMHHINGRVGFPPLFQTLVRELIESGKPFREAK